MMPNPKTEIKNIVSRHWGGRRSRPVARCGWAEARLPYPVAGTRTPATGPAHALALGEPSGTALHLRQAPAAGGGGRVRAQEGTLLA